MRISVWMPSTCAGAYAHTSWELLTSCSSIYSHKLDPLSVLGLAVFGMIMSKEVLLILCASSTIKFKHFFGHYNTYILTMLKVWTFNYIIDACVCIIFLHPSLRQGMRLYLVWDSEGISETTDTVVEDIFQCVDDSDSEAPRKKAL